MCIRRAVARGAFVPKVAYLIYRLYGSVSVYGVPVPVT